MDEGNKFVRERMGKGRPDFTSSNNQIHIFILLGRYNRPHHNPQHKANLPHQYNSHLITPTLPYLIYMKSFTTRQHVAVRSSSIEAVVKGECTDTNGSFEQHVLTLTCLIQTGTSGRYHIPSCITKIDHISKSRYQLHLQCGKLDSSIQAHHHCHSLLFLHSLLRSQTNMISNQDGGSCYRLRMGLLPISDPLPPLLLLHRPLCRILDCSLQGRHPPRPLQSFTVNQSLNHHPQTLSSPLDLVYRDLDSLRIFLPGKGMTMIASLPNSGGRTVENRRLRLHSTSPTWSLSLRGPTQRVQIN